MRRILKEKISILIIGLILLGSISAYAKESVSDNSVAASRISVEDKETAEELKSAGVELVFDASFSAQDYRNYLERNDLLPDREALTDSKEEDEEPDDGVGSIVMTNVQNTLNVREDPDEGSAKVGYLYKDCGGEVLERKNGWTKLRSGKLIGWASDEFLVFGEEAKQLSEEVGSMRASVVGDALRVRKEPSTDAGVYGLVAAYETLDVVEEGDEWIGVEYEGDVGYVARDYVNLCFHVDAGETIEEVKAREAELEAQRKAAAKERLRQDKEAAKSADDTRLLAALIQCEAANQPYEGQVAVAAVVMNRVRSSGYPNSVSSVIFASGQFTPAISGKVMKAYNGNVKSSCLQAASEAMAGVSNVGGATHFKRVGLHDGGTVIGNHIFW